MPDCMGPGSDRAECAIGVGLPQKMGRFSALNQGFRGQKERLKRYASGSVRDRRKRATL